MKRSQVNMIMRCADDFIRTRQFYLPPFAYWSPTAWKGKGEEAGEIVSNRLGWDITDFGSGNFHSTGLFLFTIRNGSLEAMREKRGKLYCEKLMVVEVDQVTPMHFHWNKTEDIINRGGGNLAIQLHNATENEGLAETPVTVSMDGVKHHLKAGEIAVLAPGQSITLPPYLYHKFWGERERVLVGEVSLVNDDQHDNRFYDPIGRFPMIEEDEEPLHLLVTDYPNYYAPARKKAEKAA